MNQALGHQLLERLNETDVPAYYESFLERLEGSEGSKITVLTSQSAQQSEKRNG